jgi:hypothetical protein
VKVALSRASGLERRGQVLGMRALQQGRSSGAAAVTGAGRVLVHLDGAARMELVTMRSSADAQTQQQAAASVDLSSQLISSLHAQVARSAGTGTGAASTAAGVTAQQSRATVALVKQIVISLPSARSAQVRARLDHALAVLAAANVDVTTALSGAAASGDGSSSSSVQAALDATAQSSVQIGSLIHASGSGSATGVAGVSTRARR